MSPLSACAFATGPLRLHTPHGATGLAQLVTDTVSLPRSTTVELCDWPVQPLSRTPSEPGVPSNSMWLGQSHWQRLSQNWRPLLALPQLALPGGSQPSPSSTTPSPQSQGNAAWPVCCWYWVRSAWHAALELPVQCATSQYVTQSACAIGARPLHSLPTCATTGRDTKAVRMHANPPSAARALHEFIRLMTIAPSEPR